ncbi:MAG: sodium:proton exchanger [Bacteroidetes bacterium]|jgi:potassium/hydrogen antiporter|nr:sodium:proton exchanger [Bacteroidota bacterium]MBT3750317.1 sodium:proton exchanger [Bacteroidota bacterium]MBT4400354.1 sodium:proton exchanger [Bacteroidota bacterium]MBT4411310.1 sodium:proton exchanger [Bacteroidota bacterium]MBT5426517.1 sodium:proton exchanger [Bacteroidota bacterium]
MNSYSIIIAASLVIIISYFFNRFAQKTSFPSVLLLIILGIGLKQIDKVTGLLDGFDLLPVLEVLGIIGLIMIVLEAALDLKLSKDKTSLILKSLALAFLGLIVNAGLIALIIKSIWILDWYVSFLYSIPLSIMSSAIIIPSVESLIGRKKEFMIYESTFSDVLGIMMFYFFLSAGHQDTSGILAWNIVGNIGLTIAISVISSYLLLFVFQKIPSETKFFLMIAVLVLLYALAKQLHLSSLLIILVFGLVLSNYKIFTGGKLKKFFIPEDLAVIKEDFTMVTMESSFIVRTFFFFIFGLSISINSLFEGRVILISILILAVIFASRFGLARLIIGKNSYPEWQIAPRGLITILLFYGIPADYHIEGFQDFQGILLFVILLTSIIMGHAMIRNRHKIIHPDHVEFQVVNDYNNTKQQFNNKADSDGIPME